MCEFRKKEIWGGIDLQRTRADQVCLTKSSECFRSVVSRYKEILLISVVVRVIRSVDFFRAIFVGFVRVSFRFFGSIVSSLRAEDNPEKSDCRGGTPEILQEM